MDIALQCWGMVPGILALVGAAPGLGVESGALVPPVPCFLVSSVPVWVCHECNHPG